MASPDSAARQSVRHGQANSTSYTVGTALRGGGGTRRHRADLAVLVLLGVGAVAAPTVPSGGADVSAERVLRRYVQATLSTGDAATAAALTCSRPRLENIQQWHEELAENIRRFRLPPLHAEISSYTGTVAGERVTASADVAVTLII